MLTLKHRIISTTTLLVLDFLWIAIFMGSKYNTMIKNVQGSAMTPNLFFAFIAYTLMVIGLNTFVLPGIDVNNVTISECLSSGFIFGLVLYGVYDFTTGALLKKWDMQLAIIDVLWGGLVYFASCYILKIVH